MEMQNCPRCNGRAMTREIHNEFTANCRKCNAHLDDYYPTRKAAKKAWNKSVANFRKLAKGEQK